MTVEEIWSDSQQPTFYAVHAVSLGRLSFTATKHLPRQLHFQVKLCKIQAFDNIKDTKTQPCSKWRRLDWTLQWRHQPQPIIFSREETDFDCVYVAKAHEGIKSKISRIRTGNQIISSTIWNEWNQINFKKWKTKWYNPICRASAICSLCKYSDYLFQTASKKTHFITC